MAVRHAKGEEALPLAHDGNGAAFSLPLWRFVSCLFRFEHSVAYFAIRSSDTQPPQIPNAKKVHFVAASFGRLTIAASMNRQRLALSSGNAGITLSPNTGNA